MNPKRLVRLPIAAFAGALGAVILITVALLPFGVDLDPANTRLIFGACFIIFLAVMAKYLK